jgi:hypothetical protein
VCNTFIEVQNATFKIGHQTGYKQGFAEGMRSALGGGPKAGGLVTPDGRPLS